MSKVKNGINYIGIDDNGVPTNYVLKTLELGAWNMDTTYSVLVAHGLSATEFKTVIDIRFIVRDDADGQYYSCPDNDSNVNIQSTNIFVQAVIGGKFDNTLFDQTVVARAPYNRGYVTFMYKPDA
jgi:hypothetical protein